MVPISDDPARFEAGSTLWHEDGRTLTVAGSRRHRDRLLVRFEGASTRDDAEALRGSLYVDAGELRALGEGEFWEHELVGCEAVDPTGASLGTVGRVVPGAAQDLLALDTAAGERLVPLVAAIVTEVDVAGRRIVVEAPEGLLD